MHEPLHDQTVHLLTLCTTLREGLRAADACISPLNQHLAELTSAGVTELHIEGPVIYSRPTSTSSANLSDLLIYQAAIFLPGGIGALTWRSHEYRDHTSRSYGEAVDLAGRFTPFAECPALVRAMLVSHAGPMLDRLMQDVRLLGS